MEKSKSIKPVSSKNITTCYHCGASFSFDLSRIPSTTVSIECLECGQEAPILARVVKTTPGKSRGSSPCPESDSKISQNRQALSHADSEPEFFGVRSSREEEDHSESNMLWLATYGDMMSILLIFFVLMFAISSVDKRKFEIAMGSISHALGSTITFPQASPNSQPNPPPKSLEELKKELEAAKSMPSQMEVFRKQVQTERVALSNLRKQLMRFIEENNLQDKFTLVDENDGLILVAQDMIMFDLGHAELRPQVLGDLQKIGSILTAIGNNIVVEGHTDDLPISGRFASNWELSVARATNVIHFFISQSGLDPSRLAAGGYAYYKPRYSNKTADREKNRRIEVVVKKKYSDDLVDELLSPN